MKLLQRSVEIEPFQYQLNQQYSENDLHNLLAIRLQSLYITLQDDPSKFYETAWNLFDVNCKYFPTLANDPRNHKLYEMWDLTPRDDQIQHWRFVDSVERTQYIQARKKRFFKGKLS